MRTILPLPALAKLGKFAFRQTAKLGFILTIFLLGMLSGVGMLATHLGARAPWHTLAGHRFIAIGDYEIVSARQVGPHTMFLLLDEELRYFYQRFASADITTEVPEGKTLQVRVVNGKKVAAVTNRTTTIIGTKGESYVDQANSLTERANKPPEEVALVIGNGSGNLLEDLPIPPPPTDILPLENE